MPRGTVLRYFCMRSLLLLLPATLAFGCARDDSIRDASAAGVTDSAGPRVSTVARWPRDTGVVVPLAAPGLPARDFPAPRRPISSIVSPQWSDEATRDAAHEADTVMALLGVRPGMAVADIGAGSGYYVARMARRVGPAGVVYGQDIMPRYLRYLRERVDRDELTNVRLALGDPHLDVVKAGGKRELPRVRGVRRHPVDAQLGRGRGDREPERAAAGRRRRRILFDHDADVRLAAGRDRQRHVAQIGDVQRGQAGRQAVARHIAMRPTCAVV